MGYVIGRDVGPLAHGVRDDVDGGAVPQAHERTLDMKLVAAFPYLDVSWDSPCTGQRG